MSTTTRGLSVHDLGLRTGPEFRLQGVTFRVAAGERVVVLGPNASGKSTLLRLIVGLVPPDAGTVAWDGGVLSEPGRIRVPPAERSMGLLFPEGVLFPHLDAAANVALGVAPELPPDRGAERVLAALAAMRVEALARRAVATLSTGELQRVALARCLAQRPALLLLDEPFQSIDALARRAIMADLRAASEVDGIGVLLVTHEPGEAAHFADRVVLLRDGALAQVGRPAELYREPVDRWAAVFIGEVGELDTREAADWGIGLPQECGGGPVVFRPEDLRLEATEESPLSVAEVRDLCGPVEIVVAAPDGARLTSRTYDRTGLRPGQPVTGRIERALALPNSGGDA